MKLLKISVSGLPLLKDDCDIDFLASQRVTAAHAEKMNAIFNVGKQQFMQNNVMAVIGINASGKTTVLKLIAFVCKMLNNKPLNDSGYTEIFDELKEGSNVIIRSYFYTNSFASQSCTKNGSINLLTTIITKNDNRLAIVAETLESKAVATGLHKKSIFDFTESKISFSRETANEFLLDDVSIMVAFNKRYNEQIIISDMLRYTNTNQLRLSKDCPLELIAFFDPNVEYLHFKPNGKDINIALKFRGKKEITLNRFSELNRYLSSGTIKGINTFLGAINVFRTGGYLIIDELENHFNREIVSTLIRFYMDKKVNVKGAVLIFSTHYAELLDEFERNDNIYITRNQSGITVDNLSVILKRNDIKKSDAYQSGFLGGTTPMYDSYMDLKKSIIRVNKEV